MFVPSPGGSVCNRDPFTGELYCSPDFVMIRKATMLVEAEFYKISLGERRIVPQRYETNWSFKVDGVPYTGSFVESGTEFFDVTFYDGPSGNITDFNVPIAAYDYFDETLKSSSTAFLFTY